MNVAKADPRSISNLFLALTLSLSFLFIACGQEDLVETANDNPPVFFTTGGQSVYLKPEAAKYIAFDRSKTDSNLLIPSDRRIFLNEFEVLSEPELNADKTRAKTLVTGVGLEAVDNLNRPLKVTLGIIGREFDKATGKFKSATRVFSAQGDVLDNAQEFRISGSTESFLTGMGFLMKEGRMTLLQLQRKTLTGLYDNGDALDATAMVTLPGGWAAVGILVRIKKNDTSGFTPFIQDSIFYSASSSVQ